MASGGTVGPCSSGARVVPGETGACVVSGARVGEGSSPLQGTQVVEAPTQLKQVFQPAIRDMLHKVRCGKLAKEHPLRKLNRVDQSIRQSVSELEEREAGGCKVASLDT